MSDEDSQSHYTPESWTSKTPVYVTLNNGKTLKLERVTFHRIKPEPETEEEWA